MTDKIDGRFELYRVVLDYEALQDAFADRIEDLNTTLTEIDAAGDLTRGNMQRLLGSTDPSAWRPTTKRKQSRQFGWETLGKALKGTGMALVLVVDDERFADTKERLAKRRRAKNVLPNGSIRVPAWLITKETSQNMHSLRNQKLSPRQRQMIAKRAARIRWKRVEK